MDISAYEHIRSGGAGFYEQVRGLIAVWGKEAVQFLDGLITNDMKTLEDGQQMLAAFPNAQGRLLAVVRVLRQGDRFLFDTEGATREKVFNNLFRFTFAGDFFVEDISDQFRDFELFGTRDLPSLTVGLPTPVVAFQGQGGSRLLFVPLDSSDTFREKLVSDAAVQIPDDLYETLRIENGIPKYGIDMDETTIVPELGLDGLISYNKGCYIGQEIIARIHFRGHVAKRLTGLISEQDTRLIAGAELISKEGKNAGRITSVTYSARMERNVALAFVRYDYLSDSTVLQVGDSDVVVSGVPFI